MGPKTRKSISLWQSCDNCSCIISSKDVETHSSECELPSAEKRHCFIENKTLFARIEEIKATDIEEGVRSYKNDLIFIAQSAMQLCGFLVGDPVVINTKSGKFVRKAWPKIDGSLTVVYMFNQGLLDINQNIFKEIISINNFNTSPSPLKEVIFKLKDSTISNMETFLNILQFKFVYNIYNIGTILCVPFYGRTVNIELIQLIPETILEESLPDLNQLSLEDKFYIVLDKTKWTLLETEEIKASPKTTLANVGGYTIILSDLKRDIDLVIKSSIHSASDDQIFLGLLLYGFHGTGKTLIAEALANESGVDVLKIQVSDLSSKFSGENQRKIKELFAKACSCEPSIILIDNIDSIAPATSEGENRKILATLSSGFDSLKGHRIVVIATALSPENVHPALRRPGRLENEIEIGVPTEEERKDILSKFVPEVDLNEDVKETASITHGYVGADLASVIAQARSHAGISGSKLTTDDLAWAVKRVTPSAMRQVQLQINKIRWDDIGGQEMLKLKLRQAVEWPLLHPEAFEKLGITPPRGILMFGPPGCSKTMIAKAIATETSLNFLSVKGSDIFSKWVGESERAVKELFGRARRVAPAVIFLDEVDALCPSRDGSTHGGGSAVQDRVLSQLLTEMDGVQPLNNVIIIAATNRPDRIDKAFLRPGRLDRLIYVPLPDSETRLHILKVKTKKTPLSPCVDLSLLARDTEGYSGAEIVAVCNEAAMNALEESMESSHVKMDHFNKALKIVTPRTPEWLIKIYEDYINKSNLK